MPSSRMAIVRTTKTATLVAMNRAMRFILTPKPGHRDAPGADRVH